MADAAAASSCSSSAPWLVNGVATLTTLEGVSDPPDFLVIAHRAGAHDAPENTLLALERAIQAHADIAEIDVQRTKDGVGRRECTTQI